MPVGVSASRIDDQVADALSSLIIPEGFRDRVEGAIRGKIEHAEALSQMESIRSAIKRIEFSWEKGYINMEDYIAKRDALQKELELMRLADYDEMIQVARYTRKFQELLGSMQSFGST